MDIEERRSQKLEILKLTGANMLIAEWSGRKVKVYTETKQILRQFNMSHDVVGVQCSGDGNDACIAIAMVNGKTDLYRGTGQLIRRG